MPNRVTAREAADTIREALRSASEWFDTEGFQVLASDTHRAVAALDVLVDAAERAERIAATRHDTIAAIEASYTRAEAAEARADTLAETMGNIGRYASAHTERDERRILLMALYAIAGDCSAALAAADGAADSKEGT